MEGKWIKIAPKPSQLGPCSLRRHSNKAASNLRLVTCVRTSQALLVSGFRSLQSSLNSPLLGRYHELCTSTVPKGLTPGTSSWALLLLDVPTQSVSPPTSQDVTNERRKKEAKFKWIHTAFTGRADIV